MVEVAVVPCLLSRLLMPAHGGECPWASRNWRDGEICPVQSPNLHRRHHGELQKRGLLSQVYTLQVCSSVDLGAGGPEIELSVARRRGLAVCDVLNRSILQGVPICVHTVHSWGSPVGEGKWCRRGAGKCAQPGKALTAVLSLSHDKQTGGTKTLDAALEGLVTQEHLYRRLARLMASLCKKQRLGWNWVADVAFRADRKSVV